MCNSFFRKELQLINIETLKYKIAIRSPQLYFQRQDPKICIKIAEVKGKKKYYAYLQCILRKYVLITKRMTVTIWWRTLTLTILTMLAKLVSIVKNKTNSLTCTEKNCIIFVLFFPMMHNFNIVMRNITKFTLRIILKKYLPIFKISGLSEAR